MDKLIRDLRKLSRKLQRESESCRHVDDAMRLTLMARANELDEIIKRLKAWDR